MRATTLVELAIGEERSFKTVIAELERRSGEPPDPEAATAAVRAYEAARVEPCVAATLLGSIRHPLGYGTALAILRGPAGPSAAAHSYAAEAIAAMVGSRCAEDLLPWLRDDPSPAVRRAAAHTLAKAGVREAIPFIHEAFTGGRLFVRTARESLVDVGVDDATVAVWLQSERSTDAILGCAVVFERLERARWRRPVREPGVALAPLVLTALDRAASMTLRYQRESLEAWAATVGGRSA